MTAPPKKPRLGGGLDALIPAAPRRAIADEPRAAIEDVHPSRTQPRKRFDAPALDELAQSIREVGVLEPILVRRRPQGGYEIVAGERRWRAAQRAGLREVPIFVRELNAKDAFEVALIENLQREDLSPLETARAFQRLIDEHGHTHETVAKRVGKDRTTVTNALRLLRLPAPVLALVEEGKLTEGHARALLTAQDPKSIERLGTEAVTKRWSVRETERRAQLASRTKSRKTDGKGATKSSANLRDLETRLSRALGTRVRVEDEKGKGRIVVPYSTLDELDRLLAKLLG